MQYELNRLSKEEYNILTKIKALQGSMENRELKLKKLNVYEMYEVIHSTYTKMDNLEALKRAIFIQWYASSEPSVYSGIGSLKQFDEELNIKKVITLISSNNLDDEFMIMLKHYNLVSNFYFDAFNQNVLKSFINQLTSKKIFYEMRENQERGQMGEYWNSIIKNRI